MGTSCLGPVPELGPWRGSRKMCRGRWISLAAAILLALASILLAPALRGLEILEQASGRVILRVAMEPGEEFQICFIHSVNRRPVCDTLGWEGERLVVLRSRFDSFGAGMPDGSSGDGTLHTLGDGSLEWRGYRPLPEVTLRVGRVAEHRLLIKGRDIPLDRLVKPGQALTLRPGRSSIWDRLATRWVE